MKYYEQLRYDESIYTGLWVTSVALIDDIITHIV